MGKDQACASLASLHLSRVEGQPLLAVSHHECLDARIDLWQHHCHFSERLDMLTWRRQIAMAVFRGTPRYLCSPLSADTPCCSWVVSSHMCWHASASVSRLPLDTRICGWGCLRTGRSPSLHTAVPASVKLALWSGAAACEFVAGQHREAQQSCSSRSCLKCTNLLPSGMFHACRWPWCCGPSGDVHPEQRMCDSL